MKSIVLKLSKTCLYSLIIIPLFFSVNSCADEDISKKSDEGIEKTESTEKAKKEIPKYARVFSTEDTFENAKEDLLAAIAENGLVISYTSHAKSMLDNTAAVSSITGSVYENAEILLFCKADLSHKLVAGNPHNIVLCPYSIAIYVLTDEPGRVYISYRTVQASDEKIKALTKPIEDLLIKIIEEVI